MINALFELIMLALTLAAFVLAYVVIVPTY